MTRNNVIDEMINEETMYIHDWQLKDMIVYDNRAQYTIETALQEKETKTCYGIKLVQ